MSYRQYAPPAPSLLGYDPVFCLPPDHLARLVEEVVEESVVPEVRPTGPGQPPYDPRLCVKVLLYGYATGVRSSRQMEKNCRESLPYLYLTRGDTPSYRTLCLVRVNNWEIIEDAWVGLFTVANSLGMKRVGRIVLDSSKLRANAGKEMVVKRDEFDAAKEQLREILAEAEAVDEQEATEGYEGETRTGKNIDRCQMRDILRAARKRLAGRNHGLGEEPSESDQEEKGEASGSAVRGLSGRMKERVKEAIAAIEEAESDGREHLCLTDPDARMMQGGVEKKVRECHSFEVAIDRDSGLLVAEGVTQSGSDNERLKPLVEAAREHEPEGIQAVDGDSGYFKSTPVADLIEAGVDTCIPDSTTAGELHRGAQIGTRFGSGKVEFDYDASGDLYQCPEGNTLRFTGTLISKANM